MIRLLLIEDELTLATIIAETLSSNGFEVDIATNGDEGLRKFFDRKYDVVATDIMMPKTDGFTVVEHIRQKNKNIPILFLSARTSVEDVIHGFEIGCCDYLRKPFAVKELIVRIKALINRNSEITKSQNHNFQIGKYTFDSNRQTLTLNNKITELSSRESDVLKYLCTNQGEIVRNTTILKDLWDDDNFFTGRSLHVHITKLRHKLSQDNTIEIINYRGLGYKLIS